MIFKGGFEVVSFFKKFNRRHGVPGMAVAALVLMMGQSAFGVSTNTAVASATTTNGIPVSAQTSSVPFSIVSPGLSISKTLTTPAGRPALVGETNVFTISIANTGTVTVDVVPLADTFLTNLLTIVSQTPPANSTNLVAGTLSWTNLGPLTAGQTTNITVQFVAGAIGTGTNIAVSVPVITNGTPINAVTSSAPHSAVTSGMTLVKTVQSPTNRAAAIGETIQFKISASNTGTVTLDTLPLNDTFNTNLLAFVNATPGQTTASSNLITWANIGPLASGASTNIFVNFTVLTNGIGTNVVTSAPTTTNSVPVPPATNSVPFTDVNPAIAITKTLISPSGRPAAIGETNVFTLVVTNIGNVTLDTVPVTDSFDSTKMTFLSAAPAVNTTNANSVMWTNVGPLTAGSSMTITAKFVVVASGTSTNTGVTTPTTTNGVPVPPATNSVPYTDVAPGYTLNKTLTSPSGRPAAIGETFSFQIAVTNTGNITLDTVPLVDTFNTNLLAVVSQTPGATSTNLALGTLSWANVGPVLAGQATTVTVQFLAITNGTGTNVVSAAPTTTNGVPVVTSTSSAPYTAVNPAVAITKTLISPTGRPAELGETNVFTLVVTNIGSVTLDTVPVTDSFDSTKIMFLSAVPAANTTNANSVVWNNVGPLTPGSSATITANFVVVSGGSGTNTGVTAPTTTNGVPVAPVTNTAPYTSVSAGMTLVKTVQSPTNRAAAIGETIQFKISASNTGTVTLDTVPLADTFNTNLLAYVNATPGQTTSAGNLITWTNVGPLAAGATTNIYVNFTVLTNGIGTNAAASSPTTTNGVPVPPMTNSVPFTDVNPHMTLVKVVTSPTNRPAAIGETVTFTITASNNGDTTLDTVPLTDTFSTALLSLASQTPGANSTNSGAGTLSWTNIGPLAVGASTNVVVNFIALASGTGTNAAASSPTTTNGVPVPPATNSVPYTNVHPLIALTKTLVSPAGRPALVGETNVFTITVTNTGNIAIDTLSVTDLFNSATLAYASASPLPATTNAASLVWTGLGPLAVGGSTTITAAFTSVSGGSDTNMAVAAPVITNGVPVSPVTNSAPYSAVPAAMVVTKTLVTPSNRPAALGETLTFQIVVSNSNPVAIGPVPLTDTFDGAVLQFISASIAPDTTNANSLTWTNVGPISAGGTVTITVSFKAIGVTTMLDKSPAWKLGAGSRAVLAVSNPWKFDDAAFPRIGNRQKRGILLSSS